MYLKSKYKKDVDIKFSAWPATPTTDSKGKEAIKGAVYMHRSGCNLFHNDHAASTIALSVLVTIEMLNALNSLSENASMFQLPPWRDPSLVGAVMLSFALHFVILTPFWHKIFHTVWLDANEWLVVLWFSMPVVILDELLKWYGRI